MNELTRLKVANDVIATIGRSRCKYGTKPPHPPETWKWGFEGVDRIKRTRKDSDGNIISETWGKYRARIRFCDAASGKDDRKTIGYYKKAEDAGRAYREAHLLYWGALSHFIKEVTL